MKLVHQDQLSSARATAVSDEVAIRFYFEKRVAMAIFKISYPFKPFQGNYTVKSLQKKSFRKIMPPLEGAVKNILDTQR